ncbi:MAG: tripartite tricarboxylate transporter permease [Halodesulfurarchaeum sp.]
MELLGARLVSNPSEAVAGLSFIACGILLGTASGLTPGLHVNTLALLLAAIAPSFPGSPHLVGAAMLAAGVVHSFLDIVPALAIGVPDAAMAMTALPGHRMVLGGRGKEALRLSALGSGSAILAAVVLGVPITRLMGRVAPFLIQHLPIVLFAIASVMIVTEPTLERAFGGVLGVVMSGTLGLLTLDLTVQGVLPAGDMLMPLLSGLFGIPVLLLAARGRGVPAQKGTSIAANPLRSVFWGLLGALSGAVVAYIPGVSAAVAAAIAFVMTPGNAGDRGFVVTISGVNTANTVFALFALVSLGSPRTGVLVAFEEANLPPNLPLLLATILLAASVAFVLVPYLGDRYLRLVGNADSRTLSLVVGGGLVLLAGLFTGFVGVLVLAVAAAIGMIPIWFNSRRVHLMGVLFVPLAL